MYHNALSVRGPLINLYFDRFSNPILPFHIFNLRSSQQKEGKSVILLCLFSSQAVFHAFQVSKPDWLETTIMGLNFSQNTVPRELWRPKKQKGPAAEDACPCYSGARLCTASRGYTRLDARPCVFNSTHGRPCVIAYGTFLISFSSSFRRASNFFQGDFQRVTIRVLLEFSITTFIFVQSTIEDYFSN